MYEAEGYDFSGTRRYDNMNDYRTKSMLVIPMEDEKCHVIGVLQLINALDDAGNIIPFEEDVVPFITALASLAGVCLNNRRMAQNIQDMLHSFVQVRKTDHAGRDHG